MDVDGLLETVTPGQFDEWLAYRKIEPDWIEILLETLRLGFASICCASGLKCEPADFDVHRKKSDSRSEANPVQIELAISQVLGAPA